MKKSLPSLTAEVWNTRAGKKKVAALCSVVASPPPKKKKSGLNPEVNRIFWAKMSLISFKAPPVWEKGHFHF